MSSTPSFERGRFYSSYSRGSTGEYQPRPPSAEGRAAGKTFQAAQFQGSRHGSLVVSPNKNSLHKITKMFRSKEGKGGTSKGPGGDKLRVPSEAEAGLNGDGSGFVGGARSPEGSPNAFRRIRSYSVGSRTALKVRRGKDREEQFFMWKPVKRKRCEWESMSGRQLTIKDTHISELGKAELEALQQIAIARLQEIDISVSKSSIRSGKLKVVKRKASNERIAVFGQPLTAVLDQDKSRTLTSPVHATPPAEASFTSPPSSSSVIPSNTNNNTQHYHPDQPVASSTWSNSQPDSFAPFTVSSSEKSTSSSHRPLAREDSILPPSPQVPLLVRKTIDHLDNNGIKTEGLFRVPGAKARIDMIKQKFDAGEDFELTEDTSPHDVACVFKEFFRSLPEPLMTRELYYPLLKTRKLTTKGLQKTALRYLVVLLPRPNRDTLQELLQFLCRVALHSNGIILMDGTEESGNRMTEDNLATVLGPNILHNECRSKSPQSSYSVMKQDPEELSLVCQVMADLIKMQDAIFTVPAELYDAALQHLFLFDHEAVDAIMRRKCIELEFNESDSKPDVPLSPQDVPSPQSNGCIGLEELDSPQRSATIASTPSTLSVKAFQRSHSYQETERSLDNVMKDLEEMLSEGLGVSYRRHSSNDSAMGESECVTSPLQNGQTQDSADHHLDDPHMYNSVDSALSNHSPHHSTSSEEGCARIEWVEEVDSPFISFPNTPSLSLHAHMSSGISVHSESPGPIASPYRVNSPKLGKVGTLMVSELAGSLPVLAPLAIESLSQSTTHSSLSRTSSSPFSSSKKLRKSTASINSQDSRGSKKDLRKKKKTGLDEKMPSFDLQRSPILGRREVKPVAASSPASGGSGGETLHDITPRFHFNIQTSTEVLI
ncbi:PREDICTED: rho GTPase-activating protein 6-like [Amphimedon queenslandica]|uniref:Rho-GAP domain-containing protein n=1 Tax=Amphimedon queenslandica TaxID=400682 RepID=A0A1X7V4M4_AMPQE|nr:PREDICTED: rho GTPase-activating protein 6-like [Amphimedon queenslandica]|eukprot:XP_019850856.1 PREDICTED: rho GTPase-activating protein 6-like [Amphimedon queenslandica]